MTSQITVSTADGRSFSRPVDRDEFAVGRDSRNHLVLGDRQVSKFHCQIVKREHGFAVKDLNSSNGTLINGIRSDGEVLISTGDRIRVGPYELVFAEDEDGLPGYLQAKAPSPVPSTFDPAAEAPQDLDVSDLLDPVGGEAPPSTDQGPQFNHGLDVTDPRVAPSAGTPVGAEQAPGSGLTPREGHAYLEIVDGDGKGHMITVGSRGVTIGAGSRNNLVLDDPFVSRQHARVDMEGGRYLVKDMGSTNGIRVDSQDVAQAELVNGTRLQVGGVLMLFRRPGEAAPGVAVAVPPPLPPSGHPTQALTPGPPSRSGRTAATMREMSALPPSVQNSTTLGPQTQAPAAPARPRPAPADKPSGVVAIGNLKFRYWQVAILGAIGVFLVLALVWQAAQYAFNFGSGLEQRDMEPVFQAGLAAYGIQDWDTAEQYFSQITDIDPRYQDAVTQMENIARERDNMSRYEDAQRFVAVYTLSKKHDDFTQAYDSHKSIPATSFYFPMAKALVEPLVPVAAQRLVDQAFVQLEAEDVEGALRLLDEAEVYDPDVAGTDELREIADIKNRRKRTKAIEEYRANLGRDLEAVASEPTEDDAAAAERERERERERDRDRDSDRSDRHRDRGSSSGKEVGSQAISAYTSGDVDSARAMLQRAVDAASDPGEKLELQDVLGRVDYVERKFAAGKRAMDSGDLDSALNSFEAAYKKITQMDSSSGNERRNDIKQALAECRYRRGRAAFDQGKYAKANFEWRSGKKAWSGHSGISKGRKELEEVAKGYFNEGYLAEREGTSAGTDDARDAYEKVMAIAPRGDGFVYYEKAADRLAGL